MVISVVHQRATPVTKINRIIKCIYFFLNQFGISREMPYLHIFSATTQRDLTITVGYHNSPDRNAICQFYAGPMTSAETRRFNCDNPIYGRFVFIQRTGDAITKSLALCEVKVFGNNGEQIFCQSRFSLVFMNEAQLTI